MQKWINKFVFDYVSGSGFKKYMGTDESSIIRVINELKNGGEVVNIPLAGQLRGAGVTGDSTLVGNEEAMGLYTDQVRVSLFRNAVAFTDAQTFKTELDLFNAARKRLKDWSANKLRNDIVSALGSVIIKGTADSDGFTLDSAVDYASATATQRNNFLVNNTDRIIMGVNSGTNKTSGVMATALATLASPTDKITAAMLSRAKRAALKTGATSGTSITPYQSDDDSGENWFVYFAPSEQFRDLLTDTAILEAYRHAAEKGKNNRLFTSGDIIFEGIIVKEVPQISVLTGAGNSCDVAVGYLCGQSAISVAYGQDPTPVSDVTDYGYKKGCGIKEIRGVKKTSFNGTQYGVVSVYSASVADA